jgi:small subunit ribosomal protein S3
LGHKVHPVGFRLGVVKGWQSRWYAERDYKDIFAEDLTIRQAINKELANASVSRIEIERAAANQVSVTIHTAKPGIVIGKSGEKVDKLRTMLEAKTKKRVRLNILEIRQPELDAYLVGRSIAEQLEKRVSFRRAMKQAVQKSMRANAKGIKIIIGGRLGGAEIARSEKEVEGKIPLHTLRADIDYGLAEAHTTFGVIGIKVWIYKGDILPSKRREAAEAAQEPAAQPSFAPREREGGDRRGGDRRRSDGGQRGDRGERGERGPRPQGDRPQGGERGPRQFGDRPPRPQGQQGERPPRPQGERGPRPQGDRPQGQQGERPPRQPRPQGERPPRAQGERGERPPRQQGERTGRAEQTPAVQSTPDVTSAPATPPTPPTPETGTAQSE